MIVTFRMTIAEAKTEYIVSEIRNRYWRLRALRPGMDSKRRQLYREIKIANDELLRRGCDQIELHHWKRSMASFRTTSARSAEKKYQEAIRRSKIDGKTPVTELTTDRGMWS